MMLVASGLLRSADALFGVACVALFVVIRRLHGARLGGYLRDRAGVTLLGRPLPPLDFLLLALPLTLCGCAMLIAGVAASAPSPIVSWDLVRRMGVSLLSALLAGGAGVISLRMTAATTRDLGGMLSKTLGEKLGMACAISAHVALLSTVAISYLAVQPSYARTYNWEFLDKRWLVAVYAFAVATLVVLPLVLYRLLEPNAGTQSEPVPAEPSSTRASSPGVLGRCRPALKVALALLLSSLLVIYYFHPHFQGTAHRPLVDSHELVHLGSLLRMSQGHAPFTDAETQYGPGHQVLTHWFMTRMDFSLYGFRVSHLLFNVAAVVAIYTLVLSALPWHIGALMVLVGLWISPLRLFDSLGWGVIARWMSPFVLAICLPPLVSDARRPGVRALGMFAVGAAWGLLSWIASENFSGGLLTYCLIVILFWSMGVLGTPTAIRMSAALISGFLAVWVMVFALVHRVSELGRFLRLYFHRTGLVTAGFTNTPWSSGLDNPWFVVYVLTPYLFIASGMVFFVWVRRPPALERERRQRLQFAAMWSAAVILYLPALFRADSSHLMTGTLPLGALLVLGMTTFPSLVAGRGPSRELMRVGIVLLVVFAYPVAKSLPELITVTAGPGTAHIAKLPDTVGALVHRRTRAADPDDRLGFTPDPRRCCSENEWTYAQWSDLMTEIKRVTAGRATLVHKFEGTVPAALYFFADLTVGTSITDPTMMILTESDMTRWRADLDRNPVACLVTTDARAAWVREILARFGRYSTYQKREPVPYTIYCRE